jgi:hypothetical protein
MQLHWLWLEWTVLEKAWAGTDIPCDNADRLLFANCTRITLGDGNRADFWHSGWLQGTRPMDAAPLLFAQTKK